MANRDDDFRRKLRWRSTVIIGVATLCVLALFTLFPSRSKVAVDVRDLDPNTRRILVWNDFFTARHYDEPLGRSVFSSCQVTDCELWDRYDSTFDLPHDAFDAVIFHGIDTGRSSIRDLPLVRSPRQRYVFLNVESPAYRPDYYNLKRFFNWTATYRRDSDVYIPYMNVRSTDTIGRQRGRFTSAWRKPVFSNATRVSVKTKLVAWFVSNGKTQSRREFYADELAKYIQVDIYGRGRRLSCAHADTHCDRLLDTTYKFYLSFENSLCRDYVTEKFLRALSHDVVPVVYGGADYKLYAPPLSYINVQDFASPRALARYLHYLDRHPEEYQKYFWWKEFYKQDGGSMWCELCEKLHDPEEPTQVYPDIKSWWDYPGACPSPKEFFSRVQ